MVGYVIPLRPRATSRDWAQVLGLLRQTLGSIAGSTDPAFQIFIASSDPRPDDFCEDLPIHWSQVDFDLPDPADYDSCQRDRNWKVTRACQEAVRAGVDWIFVCDSDDLVSSELTAAIHRDTGHEALIVNQGYELHVGKGRAYLRKDLHHICGSTFAIRARHIFRRGPETFFDGIFLRQNHKTFETWFEENGIPFAFLDAPLVSYLVGHGGNISNLIRLTSLKAQARLLIKFHLCGRRFDADLRKTFGFQSSPPA